MTHDRDTDTAQGNTDTAKLTLAPTPLCTRCHPTAVRARFPDGAPIDATQHTGDCYTARGRLLARVCRDCGARFRFPKRTRGHHVRCADCRAKRAAARDARGARAAAQRSSTRHTLTYAQHRSACELAADPIGGQLRRTAAYGLLLYAVQRAQFCGDCDHMLSADRAVLVEWRGHHGVCCADCYDATHAARVAEAPDVAVHDGRALSDPITKGSIGS